ncbi:hypothetical protein BDP27DRAFT_1419453 [Rhodocollybia butyracea]|uniref:Uncharacterized protein n=1 Tax=Rhodocollybia butyracea TaxID=206335 RepID=A0A9P5PVX2_9AGAR|nr:hypothetical protein BDP27DRAFT_1419453 [Rhodocollybia butyracea]
MCHYFVTSLPPRRDASVVFLSTLDIGLSLALAALAMHYAMFPSAVVSGGAGRSRTRIVPSTCYHWAALPHACLSSLSTVGRFKLVWKLGFRFLGLFLCRHKFNVAPVEDWSLST